MALDETTKTILIYVWRSKFRNNLRSGLPKKMGKSDIVRDSLPTQDIIELTKAELLTFFLVRRICFIFFKTTFKTFSTEGKFIYSLCVSAECDC